MIGGNLVAEFAESSLSQEPPLTANANNVMPPVFDGWFLTI